MNPIQEHRNFVASQIEKSFDNELEKAHQVGDMHKNGKWVWTEYKPGRFDWRPVKKKDNSGTVNQQHNKKEQKKSEEKKHYLLYPNGTPINLTEKTNSGRFLFEDGWLSMLKNIAQGKIKKLKEELNESTSNDKKNRETILKKIKQEEGKISEIEDEIKRRKEIENKEQKKPNFVLTDKDREEIEEKIDKLSVLPYDFELGKIKDDSDTVILHGYGKAYGDSKTITNEFTYDNGNHTEPKQQIANKLILMLKEKGVLNEENYKSFTVKMIIDLD